MLLDANGAGPFQPSNLLQCVKPKRNAKQSGLRSDSRNRLDPIGRSATPRNCYGSSRPEHRVLVPFEAILLLVVERASDSAKARLSWQHWLLQLCPAKIDGTDVEADRDCHTERRRTKLRPAFCRCRTRSIALSSQLAISSRIFHVNCGLDFVPLVFRDFGDIDLRVLEPPRFHVGGQIFQLPRGLGGPGILLLTSHDCRCSAPSH
jgi:hypothetical protein